MTNGEKIKATFPHYDIEIDELKGYVRIFYENFYTTYPWDWWNAEYKEPTTKNDLGVDCISRADAIKLLENYGSVEITNKLKDLPIVYPESDKPSGRWILLDECSNSGYYCSNCQKKLVKEGWSDTVKKIKYCPNCAAKMVEPQEREDKDVKSFN